MLELKYDNKVNLAINTIKTLGVDAIERAKSGHPGMLLDISDTALILFHYFLRFNPEDPEWIGRDNFVLSSGHVSMLLYALLHLYGYDISIEDIKNFRQLGSKTAGHPEYDINLGIEMSTGPLGQGFATSVGMALARKIQVEKYGDAYKNTVYTIMGDGDLMEGISYEAASFAGLYKLDNLVAIYDRNKITIDGSIDISFIDNIKQRFESQNWRVLEVQGDDHSQIIGALNTAQLREGKPTLIVVNTTIAVGAGEKEGSNSSHGAPLGEEAIKALKKNLNWNYKKFEVPSDVYEFTKEKINLMQKEYKIWQTNYKNIKKTDKIDLSDIKKSLEKLYTLDLKEEKEEATRKISNKYMQEFAKLDEFIGGSADLAGSNAVELKSFDYISCNKFSGKNIHFGIREHAMGAIANGLSLSGFLPFVSTFLVFSDYLRPAIRLSALMKTKLIYIFTHDSIWVGEDGPTHQPIEHLDSLRLIPNLRVYRPASHSEVMNSWLEAIKYNGPSVLVLTRQSLPFVPVKSEVSRGAYLVQKEAEELSLVVIASGSELAMAYKAINLLDEKEKSKIRLVSVPELMLFKSQDKEFILNLLPEDAKVLAIEASTASLWNFLHENLELLNINTFGESGKGEDIAEHFGLNIKKIQSKIIEEIKI